ncbi:hypothetical protein LPB140_07255 [Sphingorhabdus lutea]|uniref:Parvulin-like PPIase n=1 Tax=Sphingorhabdus lutea TaxID=1913578 RepID=A0A1L3JBW1_9SPHN|nr:peptidyl-prolyl cis-trans isomerase [Sphingorhabdus lutea]APG62616.1 hypothetical protein LPB140_07255 [Sphingorhabdus lutea]
MIKSIRSMFSSKLGTFLALAFVVLIAFAFALSDVSGSGSFGGLGGGNAAKVGSEKVAIGDLNKQVRYDFERERQNGYEGDLASFVELGGFDRTLDGIIARMTMAIFGSEYGLSVSKKMIDFEINKIDAAKGLNGQFDQASFRAFLAAQNLSEDEFRQNIINMNFAEQLLSAAAAQGEIANSMALPYASLELEQRESQIAFIPSTAFIPKSPPSDKVLNDYYRKNASKFIVPERRAINYAIFNDTILGEKAKVSEQEIAAYYKSNAAKYAGKEKRDITQVIVPTQAAAKALSDKANAGSSLADAAKAIGLAPASLASEDKQSLTSKTSAEVANAVFATAQGKIATPAKGKLGWYVMRTDKITNVSAQSIDAAKAEILALLQGEKKQNLLSEFLSEMQDSLADGTSITDIAKGNGLKVETSPKLFASGANPENNAYKPTEEMKVILPAAFQMEKDGEAQLIEIEQGKKFAIISIAEFSEAAPPAFAKVKADVMRQWAVAEGSKKAEAIANNIQKLVRSGKSLAEAVKLSGASLPPIQSISGKRSDLAKNPEQVSPALRTMFTMAPKSVKKSAAPGNNGWVVIHLVKNIRGDASGNAELLGKTKSDFGQFLGQEYIAQFLNAAQKEIGVKKDDKAIKALKNTLSNRDPVDR